MAFLELRGVEKSFGSQAVLKGLTLSVEKGTVFALLGHNGAGKTTTSRIIQGLLPADGGEICFDGKIVSEAYGHRIGVLCEDDGLYEHLNIMENLEFYGKLYKLSKETFQKRVSHYLTFFELIGFEDKIAGQLSRGMKKKVALIRTLLHDPDLLILDEPLNGLDPVVSDKLCQLIENLCTEEGKTIILTSHHLKEIESIIDDYAIIKEGKAVTLPRDVQKTTRYRFVVDPVHHNRVGLLFEHHQLEVQASKDGDGVECDIDDETLLPLILQSFLDAKVPLAGFYKTQMSLKEVYKKYGF